MNDDGDADRPLECRRDQVRMNTPALQGRDREDAIRDGRRSWAPAEARRLAVMEIEVAMFSARIGPTVALPLPSAVGG